MLLAMLSASKNKINKLAKITCRPNLFSRLIVFSLYQRTEKIRRKIAIAKM